MTDLYEILGISRDATPEEIKEAYREKAKETHSDQGGDDEAFIKIQQAYEVLSDLARRARYDETGDIHEEEYQDLVATAIEIFTEAIANDPADLALAMRNYTDVKINNLEKQITGLQKAIRRLEEIEGRIREAPERDFLRGYLQEQRAGVEKSIALFEAQIETYSASLLMLEQYVFDRRAEDPLLGMFRAGIRAAQEGRGGWFGPGGDTTSSGV